MRRLFAVVLSALLVFGFAPVAKADVAGLTPVSYTHLTLPTS